MKSEHEQAIAIASSGLNRAAIGVGAEVIALLEPAGTQVKVTRLWSRSRNGAPERGFVESVPFLAEAIDNTAMRWSAAGSRLTTLLREKISEHSQSFLLFPWESGGRVMGGVIGFARSVPPVGRVPDVLMENLNLLEWATWSANEIARLRGELRIVNERLAGRKLVERAKSALQAERSISEEEAYAYLRSLSRRRRITLVKLSVEILARRVGDACALTEIDIDRIEPNTL
jgi:ANTAR domain